MLEVKKDLYIDARDTNSGLGRFVNTKRGHNNTKFSVSHRNGISTVWIKATRRIPPDTEIFVPYGLGYEIVTHHN